MQFFPQSVFRNPKSAILLNPIDGFKNVAVLNADIQGQRFSGFSEFVVKGLLVDVGRNIHLVDHDVFAGFIATLEDRLQVGDIDAIAGNRGADSGDQALVVRPLGRNDEGFAVFRLEGIGFGSDRGDMDVHVQGCKRFSQYLVEAVRLQIGGQAHDKGAGKFGLQNGLADVLDIAVLLKKNPGYRGHDARSIMSQSCYNEFIHEVAPYLRG